ncbi:MAG TPA: transferase [Chloroflexi bacterium]|nr:transferase [Chloroflexota bacterium]
MRTVILGAGGHAQVVADILMRARDAGQPVCPIGYLDDNPRLHGHTELGLPVLGALHELPSVAHDAVIVAIGENHTRQQLFDRLQQQGERLTVARHPAAVIAPDVSIAPGTVICAGVVVNPGSVIGANVILNTGCTVDHHNHIGNHAHIAPGVHLGGDVKIGEGTLIGIGATVMPQRCIGAWSVVGAATLVHTDLPDYVVVAGVPGRVLRYTNGDREPDHAYPHVLP